MILNEKRWPCGQAPRYEIVGYIYYVRNRSDDRGLLGAFHFDIEIAKTSKEPVETVVFDETFFVESFSNAVEDVSCLKLLMLMIPSQEDPDE